MRLRNNRLYSSEDLISVELGALKYMPLPQDSPMASMLAKTPRRSVARALAEMSRLSSHMGGNPLSFLGLAGVGDLYVTIVSPLSRNFRVASSGGWIFA